VPQRAGRLHYGGYDRLYEPAAVFVNSGSIPINVTLRHNDLYYQRLAVCNQADPVRR
jgi:hypothetical protein